MPAAGPALAEEHAKAEVSLQPSSPGTISLQLLGYVEKADGRVEAVISLQDRVQVVHEGDVLDGNLKVAKVSSSAVELVELSSPAREAQPVAPAAPAQARADAHQTEPEDLAPAPLKASIPDAGHPFAAVHSAGGSSFSGGPELGYVERANGQVEAFVAEGQHVGLRKASKSFPSEFRSPLAPSVNVELASDRPPKVYPQESPAAAPAPSQPSPSVEQADAAPAIAPKLEASDASKAPEPLAVGEERRSESPEDVMPGFSPETAFADYSGSSTEPREVPPPSHDARDGAPGGPLPAGPGEATAPKSADSAPAIELPAPGGAALSFAPERLPLVNVLGYVEKEGGEKEGIVEIFGQMYLAHEGELLSGKFRVLQVTPSSVRIVDETRERSALPARDRPEIEPVAPAVSVPGSPPGPQPRRRAYPVLVVPAADGHQSSPAKFALSQPPPKLPCRLAAESLSLPAMPDGERLIGAPLSLSPPAPEASVSEVDRPSPSAGQTAGKGVSASVDVSGALSFRLFMVCRRAAYRLPGTGFPGDAFEFKEAAMGVGTAALPSHHSPDFWPQHLSSGSALGAIGMTCRTSRAPTVPFYPKADLCSETVPNSPFAVASNQG